MNNAQYQALTAVSSHWLIDLLKSPAYCWRRHLDPGRIPSESTNALRFGTLVHCLALTPNQFSKECIVMDCNRRTRAGRAEWTAVLASGLTPITVPELDKARAVVAALKARPEIRRLLVHGRKERVILQPRARGLLPLKARLDIHYEAKRQVVELKTTRDLCVIRTSMERYRYPLSAAFYRDITRSQSTIFIFVQTREPFEVEAFEMDRLQLQEGREQWQSALRRFDECWQSGEWPEAPAPEPEDDPLMMNFLPATKGNRPRFDVSVGELSL
jgi:hypothetical protein